jgi:L-aspartate oxidase
MTSSNQFDVLIVGSGAAGLSLALSLPTSYQCAVLSKSQIASGSTFWAQGGMAAVLHDRDSIEAHVADTLNAGAGLCHEDAVRFTVSRAREIVDWLLEQGVRFDYRDDMPDAEFREFHLTMEGGHSYRRILHAADQTGRAISEVLTQRATDADNVTLLPGYCIVDLINDGEKCVGAYVLDTQTNQVHAFSARAVVLATGGASKAYVYTSNPDGASGDGIASAWRAGCRIANMEFNQFHPTCLYHPEAKSFLITEALRGEGAVLQLPDGERFMARFDERGELAPRDIVARAIDHEMKRLGLDCVFLDISHRPAQFIKQHFPTVYERCLKFGVDITTDRIPVVPAAHYTCGGVVVDQAGASDLPGLYVIGETACTGLHGANRMASNSLLECFVYARSAARDIVDKQHLAPKEAPAAWDDSRVRDSDEEVIITHHWQALRRLMWDYVGIVRSDRRLEFARNSINLMREEIDGYYKRFQITRPLLELRNLAQVAALTVECALQREESRGLHFNQDHPDLNKDATDSILIPDRWPSSSIPNNLKHTLPQYRGDQAPECQP